ncbi:MAG: hypothetical protein Ct9H300mP17_14730 [Candidatus Nitrosopelagicus sp.]|nr:MAG: hypothetical protein Ct9H300mP17_14730 [Candidatus Nitrosopelagicus sp.]
MNPGKYHLSKNIEKKKFPKKEFRRIVFFQKWQKKKTLETIKFKNALWFSIDSHKE